MNYQKHYDLLMQTRKKLTSFGNLEYWENHHIIPECLGGSSKKENLVKLTAREHYIAHWLLKKIHKTGPLYRAFKAMSRGQDKRKLTSIQFERARNTQIKVTEETKLKMRAARTEEWKKAQSLKMKAYYLENPHKIYINQGFKMSNASKKKISEFQKGLPKTEEHKKKISEALIGANVGRIFQQVKCPYCDTVGGICNMKRYHFENCKTLKDSNAASVGMVITLA